MIFFLDDLSADLVECWRKLSMEELMLLNCGFVEDSCESLGLQGDPTSPSKRKSVLNVHWKDWCWSWNFSTLATSCEELTHWKRPWWWEKVKVGGEGDDRGWDVWMASLTQWIWVWVNSRIWRWTGRPGVLQSMRLQRVRQDWATGRNWTDFPYHYFITVNLSLYVCDYFFINLSAPVLGAYVFTDGIFSSWINIFIFMDCLSMSLVTVFILKSILPGC